MTMHKLSLCLFLFSISYNLTTHTTFAEEPWIDKTDLFGAGQGGYETFRIPGIIVTNKGTVLVYCEARRGSRSDWADIEVFLCRSTNGGKTWSPPWKIADSKKETVNNPVAIVDRDSDRIHFLYCINYHQCFYMYSDDDSTFLFSNPYSENNPGRHGKHEFRHRENLTVRMSTDDCKTWPVSRSLEPGISGYSDLAIGHDGTIYCAYERGGDNGFAHRFLTLARFNRAWLEAGDE